MTLENLLRFLMKYAGSLLVIRLVEEFVVQEVFRFHRRRQIEEQRDQEVRLFGRGTVLRCKQGY